MTDSGRIVTLLSVARYDMMIKQSGLGDREGRPSAAALALQFPSMYLFYPGANSIFFDFLLDKITELRYNLIRSGEKWCKVVNRC